MALQNAAPVGFSDTSTQRLISGFFISHIFHRLHMHPTVKLTFIVHYRKSFFNDLNIFQGKTFVKKAFFQYTSLKMGFFTDVLKESKILSIFWTLTYCTDVLWIKSQWNVISKLEFTHWKKLNSTNIMGLVFIDCVFFSSHIRVLEWIYTL